MGAVPAASRVASARAVKASSGGGTRGSAGSAGGDGDEFAADRPQSAIGNPYMFTGRRFDTATGLYHYRHRYFDPVTGRFTTIDPLGLWGDPGNTGNGYTYAANNPWTLVDPFGLCPPEYSGPKAGPSNWWQRFWQGRYGGLHDTFAEQFWMKIHSTETLARMSDERALLEATGLSVVGGIAIYTLAPVIGGWVASSAPIMVTLKIASWTLFGNGVANALMDGIQRHLEGESYGTIALHMAKDAAISALQSIAIGRGIGLLGRALCRLRGACFLAGTLVATSGGFVEIESIEVGDRVLTTDDAKVPNAEPDPLTWRCMTLTMPNPEAEGEPYDIEVLRPLSWFDGVGAEEGATIPFALPELKLFGQAKVIEISPCPKIEPGPGRVVLATVSHRNETVYEIRFDGSKASLYPTGRHRLYSIDRSDWVPTRDLVKGEKLRTASGEATIASIVPYPGVHRVHNLEVQTEHCYFAGEQRILCHNANSYNAAKKVTVSKSKYPEAAKHIEDAQAAGHPSRVTIRREGAGARRREAMKGNKRTPGMDRDEYPPAMTGEGGAGSSVRPVTPGDNRGAGACIGGQCHGLPDGTEIIIVVGD